MKINNIENQFINTYLYGLSIKPEEEINQKDAEPVKQLINNNSKENKKENKNQYIQNVILL